jgi:hypothetical protein
MAQYTIQDNDKASDMMWDAGRGGGGPWVHCSCGKDHSLDPDLTEEEYDRADSFEYIELDGQLFVYDCEGCEKKLSRYERFMWNNRDMIRRYLKIRIDQEKAWADQEKLLNTIAGID